MPTKSTTKKTTVKKPVAKTAAAKKTTVKKTVAKKAPVKKVIAPVVPETHACGCNHACPCGGDCACAKKKCTFGKFLKKLILIMIIFALGFVSAKMCCGKKMWNMPAHPEFDNGCLVVKCPKLAEMAPMMDADKNGCVTKQEFAAAKRANRPERRHPKHRPAPAPQANQQ